MTVKELIEKLKEYPDKFEVVIDTNKYNNLPLNEEKLIVCLENKQIVIDAYV